MKLFKDIASFLRTLSFIDLVFFFAVVVLMVLVVTLIYFIKINKEENEEFLANPKKDLEKTTEMKIIEEITKNIDPTATPTVDFTDYEKDQENKAIISYDELLKKTNNYELNYEKEEYIDDLSVKKVDLDNLVSVKKEQGPKIEVRVISYQEEEAFLEALKRLQKNLG